MARTCDITGCTDKHRARGWCYKHYTNWLKHGDPLYTQNKVPSYGAIHRRIKTIAGSASDYYCVCGAQAKHWACYRNHDTESNARGLHIMYSTNIEDYAPLCARCNTWVGPSRKGSNNANAKLTEEDVLKIRERYTKGELVTCAAESRTYGVTPTTIQDIVRNKTWKHLLP